MSSRTARFALAALVPAAALALAPLAAGQARHVHRDGASSGDEYGFAVKDAGDVNADGFADVIVGAQLHDGNGADSGMAQVLSGLDGSVLFTWVGDGPDDRFGWSVSGAGDVDGDGHDDVIVGAINDDDVASNAGSATVYSGFDGSVLHRFDGDGADDLFGYFVSDVGDLNGDGRPELIVGARRADLGAGPSSGMARVYSGLDGSVLYTFAGLAQGDNQGVAVDGCGDVNKDGVEDLIVAAYRSDEAAPNAGSARVYSGLDGSVLYTFLGSGVQDEFGVSCRGAGDVNGDGHADLIVGAWKNDTNGADAGMAQVYSGRTGSVMYTYYGDAALDQCGQTVSGVGDVDGDGMDDFAIGSFLSNAVGADAGLVRVYSGADGSLLFELLGADPLDEFGYSVSGAGDVNGDGVDDLVIGNYHDSEAGTWSGSAEIYLGDRPGSLRCFCDAASAPCSNPDAAAGCENSTGAGAILFATGSDSVALQASNPLVLHVEGARPNKTCIWLQGDLQVQTPFRDGNMCVGGATIRLPGAGCGPMPQTVDAGGAISTEDLGQGFDVVAAALCKGDDIAAGAPTTREYQLWYRDGMGPCGQGSNLSNAISIGWRN